MLTVYYLLQGHGFKWSIKNLITYIEGTRGMEAAEKLMESIGWLMVHSLTAVQNDLLLTTYY